MSVCTQYTCTMCVVFHSCFSLTVFLCVLFGVVFGVAFNVYIFTNHFAHISSRDFSNMEIVKKKKKN